MGKRCWFCFKEFETFDSRKKFCSSVCRITYNKYLLLKKCQVCNAKTYGKLCMNCFKDTRKKKNHLKKTLKRQRRIKGYHVDETPEPSKYKKY